MIDNRLAIVGKYLGYDYESITVDNTVGGVGLTASKLTIVGKRPIRIICTVETAQIRYRYDGTAPTTTEGHILNRNDVLLIEGYGNMKNIKFIRTGTTSGKIRCSYER